MVTFHKTSDTFKTGSMTLPQKYYTSDEVFAREKERVFNKYRTYAVECRVMVGRARYWQIAERIILVLASNQDMPKCKR